MARPVGSRNKNTKFAANKLKEIYGDDFDPLIIACNALRNMVDSGDDNKEILDGAMKITPYLHPKLSAQTVDFDAGEDDITEIKITFGSSEDSPTEGV
jgi:hypothetical protein